MNVVIETIRLLLRKFTGQDADLLFQLNSDPEVTRYTHDPILNHEQAQEILEQVILPQYALYNYGRWAVHLKEDLQFIGWCGLKFIAERNEVDLGYRFLRSAWGKGYATEAAYASIHYGFEKFRLNTIVGRALPENSGSINVLEKCGMHYQCEEIVHGWLHKTFLLSNPFLSHDGPPKTRI